MAAAAAAATTIVTTTTTTLEVIMYCYSRGKCPLVTGLDLE